MNQTLPSSTLKPSFLREYAPLLLLVLAILFAQYPRVFTHGDFIAPASLIFSYPPWSVVAPEGQSLPANSIISDQFDSIIPQVIFLAQKLQQGEIPLFTDKIQNGVPFLFVIRHNLLVVPLILLVILLGPGFGITAYLLGQIVLGVLFCFRYLRLVGCQYHAAAIGALCYGFNSYAVQALGFQMMLEYSLIPVALYGIEVIIATQSRHWAGILACVGYLMIVAGYPLGAFFCTTLIVTYAIVRIACSNRHRFEASTLLIGAALTALLICAPAIAASSEYFALYSWEHRMTYWRRSIDTRNFATLLVPWFFGPLTDATSTVNWHKHGIYIGVFPLFAIVAALPFLFRQHRSIFFTCFLMWLLTILYDIGGFLELVYQHIPLFRATQPVHQKIVLLAICSFLSGFAANELWSRQWNTRSQRIPLLGSAVLVALFSYIYLDYCAQLSNSENIIHYLATQFPESVALIAISLILLASLGVSRLKRSALGAACLLIAFDFATLGRNYNPTIPASMFYKSTPAIEFLKQHIGPHKLFLYETTLLANTPMAFDLATVAGRGLFTRAQMGIYKLISPEAFTRSRTQHIFGKPDTIHFSSEFFSALGLKYIVASSNTTPTEIPDQPSRAFQASQIDQKEWNTIITLKPGDSVTQRLKCLLPLSRFSVWIPVAENTLDTPGKLKLDIFSGSLRLTTFGKITPLDASPVEFEAQSLDCPVNDTLTLRWSLPKDTRGNLAVYAAKIPGADVFPQGEALIGDTQLDGDLRFRITPERELEQFKVVYDKEITIFENTAVYPRAWVTHSLRSASAHEIVGSIKEDRAMLRTTAWATAAELQRVNQIPFTQAPAHAHVQNIELSSNRQEFKVTSSLPGILVVSDNFTHGWSAAVNGKSTPILSVNNGLRGVPVPAGDARVVLEYSPPYFWPMILLSALGIALMLGLIVLRRRSGLQL